MRHRWVVLVQLLGYCIALGNCCQPPLPAFQHIPPAPQAPLLPQQTAQQFQAPPQSSLVSGVQNGLAQQAAPLTSNSIDQELTPFSQVDPQPQQQTFTPYPGYIPPPPAFSAKTELRPIPARENGLQNMAIDDNEQPVAGGCPPSITNSHQVLQCLQILPAIAMDENALSCSFEQGTKCRFQPTSASFQIARLPTPAHYRALARLSNRAESNQPQGDFLALVERTGNPNEEFVISTPITCQNGNGTLSFDFWVVGNPSAAIHVCTQDSKTRSCTKEILHGAHSFVNVQVVHPNAAVFDVEITVSNISQPTILAIDNLDYKTELCDSKQADIASVGIEATPSPDVVESFFEEGEQDEDSPASVPNRPITENGPLPPAPLRDEGFGDSGIAPSRDGPPAMSPFDLEIRQSPLQINKLDPCSQMSCDFNKDFCGYKNWRNATENTHEWKFGTSRVGNPHTGIREKSNEGGFLYVGTDEDDNSILTYVLESPKLQLNNDATLYFDLYRRSKDITLQVCLNSPNHCPLHVAPFKKETDWIQGVNFIIPHNVTKIYFKAKQWRKFKWLAIDNIRLVSEDCTQ